jgi:hypothetical protein
VAVALRARLRITTVFFTHDQEESVAEGRGMTLAPAIAQETRH